MISAGSTNGGGRAGSDGSRSADGPVGSAAPGVVVVKVDVEVEDPTEVPPPPQEATTSPRITIRTIREPARIWWATG